MLLFHLSSLSLSLSLSPLLHPVTFILLTTPLPLDKIRSLDGLLMGESLALLIPDP